MRHPVGLVQDGRMSAILDLLKSERGITMLALIIAATVLAGLRIVTADQWVTYTQWIFTAYASAKTITGVAQIITSASANGGAK